MSVKAIAAVWEDYSIKSKAELLVLLAIADHVNENGEAWPGTDSLAYKSRCTQRGVIKIISKLISVGKLDVQRNAGPRKTNIYRILIGGVNGVHPEQGCPKSGPKKEHSGSPESSGIPMNLFEPPKRSLLELPQDLAEIPEVARAWKDWRQHCAEKKKTIGSMAASKQFNRIRTWGPAKWVCAVDYSIEQNWQGIYEKLPQKQNGAVSQNGRHHLDCNL